MIDDRRCTGSVSFDSSAKRFQPVAGNSVAGEYCAAANDATFNVQLYGFNFMYNWRAVFKLLKRTLFLHADADAKAVEQTHGEWGEGAPGRGGY